ncbi:MAG: diguanylate cyclase [Bacteroidaceae bacterium]|nr:diguanylate cyclase [Bacteroidaceae bacterium]
MQTFTHEEINKMPVEELRHMLLMQLERNELIVKQNKFNMYRYECKTGVMHLMLRLPSGEIQRLAFPDYFNTTPSLVFEEKEHTRVVENIKRVLNDPNAPKTGSLGFVYKDGRHISCEYQSVFDEEGNITAIVGQHVDMYGTHERLMSTINSLHERTLYTDTISSIYETAIDFNLKNKTYKVLRATAAVRAVTGQVSSINDLANMFRDFYIEKEFHKAFTEFVNLETISERIYGHKYLSCQYKTANIGWCEARIIPIAVSTTGEVERAFFTTEIIESKREKQVGELKNSDFDNLTGLLRASSGESIINLSLRSKHKGLFMKIECDYFDAITAMLGQPVAELMLIEVARMMKEIYPRDILVRVHADEFALYITSNEVISTIEKEGPEAVLEQLNEKLKQINIPELNGITTSVSGGFIYLAKDFSTDYKALNTQASELCKEAKAKGEAQVCCMEM